MSPAAVLASEAAIKNSCVWVSFQEGVHGEVEGVGGCDTGLSIQDFRS